MLSFAIGRTARGATPAVHPVHARAAPAAGPSKGPYLDAWIRVEPDGRIAAFTGKAELGQGLRTALMQVVAEELDVDLERVSLLMADTRQTLDEGYTAGSRSMHDSGTALRSAAAQVRQILIAEAARQWAIPAQQLTTRNGEIIGPGGLRLSYAALVDERLLHVTTTIDAPLTSPDRFRFLNHSVPRVDLPAKVTGGACYVQDMRPPGLLHARVVRPPSYGATLDEVDVDPVEVMPGVVKVVRNGSFLAVVAQGEYRAVKAMRALQSSARWTEGASRLPDSTRLSAALLAMRSEDYTLAADAQLPQAGSHDNRSPASAADGPPPKQAPSRVLEATYSRPYLAHGSIGPSCAVAQFSNGELSVWTHTQGVFPDRRAIAEMLHLAPEKVRCIHVEGAGCYGHNGADDAAADAALIASVIPDRPIKVQWTRAQEHGWEPYGPAMVVKTRASVDATGKVAEWSCDVWSNTHSMRPGPAGALLAAGLVEPPFPRPEPHPIALPEGGGDRNAIPLYTFPSQRIVHHFLPDMPLRVSALRSLGAHMNVFAIESFMDELAVAAGMDPVAFRLAHLDDARAREVVTTTAREFGWPRRRSGGTQGRGCGFAFARYAHEGAFCGVAVEVELRPEKGQVLIRDVTAAIDTGQAVNPDGVRNQIEGGILQSMSWTLFEAVRFDERRILSLDWASYPILRFSSVPDRLAVHVIDRPGEPFLGCAESAQGPAAAALANAIANASGRRFRDLPLSADKLRSAAVPPERQA